MKTDRWPRLSSWVTFCALLGGIVAVAAPSTAEHGTRKAPPDVSVTRLISKAAAGVPADDDSFRGMVSDDCSVVAFESFATNLVDADTDGRQQVYLRSRGERKVSLASVSSDGDPGNQSSELDALSGNGRYVVLRSPSTNLVDRDTHSVEQIYVHDTVRGRTRLASADSSGSPADAASFGGSISADGRFVALGSLGSNLVPDDTNGQSDIFVRDRREGTVRRVSVASDGGELSDSTFDPVISGNGRSVAFTTKARLLPQDTNDGLDVYRVSRLGSHPSLVSVATDGTVLSGTQPAISASGRYVAYASGRMVFRHDMRTGVNALVSVGLDDAPVDDMEASISADGDRVVYESDEDTVVRGDTNGVNDVFLTIMSTATTVRASVGTHGAESDGFSEEPSISGNGWCVAFSGDATTLGPDVTPGTSNTYLRRLAH